MEKKNDAQEINGMFGKEGGLMKKFKMIYDVQAIPQGLTVDMVTKLADTNWVFYDSEKGHRPKLVEVGLSNEHVEVPVNFVDTKGVEVDLSTFTAKLEETTFWEKELNRCKNSPLYGFTNYYAMKAEVTNEMEAEFLKSFGITSLINVMDSDQAAAEFTDNKAGYEKYAATVDLEDLKIRRNQMAIIMKKFDEECEVRQAKAMKLAKTNAKEDKKLREKLINCITRMDVAEVVTDEAKNCIFGKWDKKMLHATDTYILCRIICNNEKLIK